ncbi:MAG: LamG domain-containing protein [Verrucomicrobiota bacterium]
MSTVHINLRDIFGVAVACQVIFRPADTPSVSGAALTISGSRSIQLDENGTGNVTLHAGRYFVRFLSITSNSDTLSITVPGDDGVYNMTALIGSGAAVVTPAPDYLRRGANLSDLPNRAAAFEAIKQGATTALSGVVRFATQGQVNAGLDSEACLSPATFTSADKWAEKEPALGVPDTDGKLLSSSATGVRTWIARPKVVTVGTDAERMALTSAEVQTLDWVKVVECHNGERRIWGVTDTDLLHVAGGWLPLGTFKLVPENTELPGITGCVAINQTLTAVPGAWTDHPTEFLYQWQRSISPFVEWAEIEQATNRTYTLRDADVGARLRVTVKAVNEMGESLVAASLPSDLVPAFALTNGLTAYWKFDEESGVRVDATGNGNDLSDSNGVGCSTGKVGNAAVLAANAYLSRVDARLEAFSLSLWIFRQDGGASVDQQVLHLGAQGMALNTFPGVSNDVLNIWGYHENGGGETITVPQNEWHHVVLVIGADFTIQVYVDAALVHSSQNPAARPVWSNMFMIGARPDGYWWTGGMIDEVALWNRTITGEEVALLYNGGAGYSIL